MPDPCQSCARCAAAVYSDGQRSTHHTRSDQTSVQNSVVSHPSLNVYSHDGQTDSPVPPRECNSCGTSDVDMFTLHEHVQTVMGGVCPGVSGQDNDFIARGVRATDYQLFKSVQWHCNALRLGGWSGVLGCSGGAVGHSRLILTNIDFVVKKRKRINDNMFPVFLF